MGTAIEKLKLEAISTVSIIARHRQCPMSDPSGRCSPSVLTDF
jgi:hypothetical protein